MVSFPPRASSCICCAQDCSRYLLALEPWLDLLYREPSPSNLAVLCDQIDGMVSALCHVVSSSRHLSAPHRAAVLFQQCSNSLANVSLGFIRALTPQQPGGSLWAVDYNEACTRIKTVIRLHACFQTAFYSSRSAMQAIPAGAQLEFSVGRVFGKYNALVARLAAIADIMTKVTSFKELSRTTIHGAALLCGHVESVVALLSRRQYDPLCVTADDPNPVPAQLKGSTTAEPAAHVGGLGTPAPIAARAGTPMFPPLVTPPWSGVGVSGVDLDIEPWTASTAPRTRRSGLPATPSVSEAVPVSRRMSLRATRHLQSSIAPSRRSLSPDGNVHCISHVWCGFRHRRPVVCAFQAEVTPVVSRPLPNWTAPWPPTCFPLLA